MTDHLTLVMGAEEQQRARQLSQEQLQPPTHVSGFETERILGKGAYGEVWLGRDGNTGRRVAIKFYNHRGGLDWSLLAREVEKLAFLFNDRYVVQLIKVGWDADPPYYVMEYLEHGSLEELLRQPLPVAEAVALFRDIVIGLVHAHNKGVMHCDLKPANILLDDDFKPRLADFGQSRLSHEQVPALGTLYYMAPEQADLKGVPDARWDVYSLGALLYRMLTGQPPYRSDELTAAMGKAGDLKQRLACYRNFLRDAPAPQAHRKVAGIDRALVDIIDRCLAVSTTKRYPNVQAVLTALDARALRQARKPLLLLGGVGSALTMLLIVVFSWIEFSTTLERTSDLLTERGLKSQSLAAKILANTVADGIDQRWRILEQLGADPDLQRMLAQAEGKPVDSKERQVLQEWLVSKHDTRLCNALVVLDAEGRCMALAWPAGNAREHLDKNFSHREYFHGRPELEGTKGLEPITEPYLSSVNPSKVSKRLQVVLSTPIIVGSKGTVRGIVFMSVEVGSFGDLQPVNPEREIEADVRAKATMAVLVDLRPDRENKKCGLVLQHPKMRGMKEPQSFYWQTQDAKLQGAIFKLTRKAGKSMPRSDQEQLMADFDEVGLIPYHTDPVGQQYAEYAGRWLAAVQPILIERDSGDIRNTGWVVIVQEGYDRIVEPVETLQSRLVVRALVGLTLIAAVVTGLWFFMTRVLDTPTSSRLFALLKNKAGLGSERSSTAHRATSSSASATPPSATALNSAK
jgi:serine/threonine protein kinase